MPTYSDALSQIYARSLYDLAQQAGGREKIEEVADELEQIVELQLSDRRFAEFFASPVIDDKRRADSLGRIFSNRVTDLTLRFLLVLNEKGRLGSFQQIRDAYDRILQDAFGMVEVDLYTASPLGDEQFDQVRNRIAEAIRKQPVVHQYTDETMIGGIRLRIGDQLIDGSVATQLRRMKDSLRSSGGAAIRSRIEHFIE